MSGLPLLSGNRKWRHQATRRPHQHCRTTSKPKSNRFLRFCCFKSKLPFGGALSREGKYLERKVAGIATTTRLEERDTSRTIMDKTMQQTCSSLRSRLDLSSHHSAISPVGRNHLILHRGTGSSRSAGNTLSRTQAYAKGRLSSATPQRKLSRSWLCTIRNMSCGNHHSEGLEPEPVSGCSLRGHTGRNESTWTDRRPSGNWDSSSSCPEATANRSMININATDRTPVSFMGFLGSSTRIAPLGWVSGCCVTLRSARRSLEAILGGDDFASMIQTLFIRSESKIYAL